MNKNEVLQAAERAEFSNLNGQIMRICNLLKPADRTLNAVYSLCKDEQYSAYPERKITQNFNYLCDSGYLTIEHPKGIQCVYDLSDGGFGAVKLSIPAKGMQLLMGVIQDPCVEI